MRDQQRIQFLVEETDDGQFKATETWSDKALYGRGATPHEAISNYCELTRPDGLEVSRDD